MAPDRQVIEQLTVLGQKYHKAYTNNDAAALAALYMWDAVIVTPQGPVYGRDTYHPSFLRSYYHVKESAHDDINAGHQNSRNRNR
jgi:ketosteroid isomerase-like protein